MAHPSTNRHGILAPGRLALPYRWPLAVLAGAAVVALSAQASVPLSFSVVPITLQDLAVIVVGGTLGATAGAGALVTYLVAGAFGAPVFALGTAGLAKILGPTGGYLLAFPVAALIAGRLGRRGNLLQCLGAVLLATIVIFAGGLSQLMLLGASLKTALAFGFYPFIPGDLLKITLASLILYRSHATLRPKA